MTAKTTLVVGASRGLGRGIARSFADAGAPVVAVARTASALAELAATSPNIETEVADAVDAAVASSLVDKYSPQHLILVAGASPGMVRFRSRPGRRSRQPGMPMSRSPSPGCGRRW
jgi:short-subunit dehydrogenase involved in D-alanine esterification of teichoic acids